MPKRQLIILLLVATCGFFGSARALDAERALSQYQQRHFSVEQGLPQVSITALEQDRRGFLWIGSQDGVARFDGKDFVAFNSRNQSGLISDLVLDLQWYKGTLWVLTLRGLHRLSEHGFEVVSGESVGALSPTDMLLDEDAAFLCSRRGLFQISGHKIVATALNKPCYSLQREGDGLIVGGKGHIYYLRQGKVITQPLPPFLAEAQVVDLVLDRGLLYIATNQGLVKFNGRQFKVLKLPQHRLDSAINRLYLDPNHILWVATNQSLIRLRGDRPYHLDAPPELASVTRFLPTKDGSLWLGTRDNGLVQLTDSWAARFDHRQGLGNTLVWSVAVSPSRGLVIGTANGVYRLKQHRFELLLRGERMPNPEAYALFVDNDDSLWIGTRRGVVKLNNNDQIVTPSTMQVLADKEIHSLYRDSASRLWVLTNQGVYYFDGQQVIAPQTKINNRELSFRAVAEFNSKLYFATQRGVYRLDDNQLLIDDHLPMAQFFTTVARIDDKLLVGSYSDGIYVYDGKRWHHLSEANGLIFNNVFSLVKFDGDLYVSGFDGVYRLGLDDLENALARGGNVDADAVLNDKGFIAGSQQAFCCNGAGLARVARFADSLWYPTRLGALRLEPNKIHRGNNSKKPEIIGIEYSGQYHDLYFMPESISLTARSLNIFFNVVAATSEINPSFRYRLIQADQSGEWSAPQQRRLVSFTNLSAGSYQFEVSASIAKDQWSEPARVSFSIPPRWYETWLARLAAVVLIATFLWFCTRLFARRQERKRRQLETLIEERTRELQEANQLLEKANKQLRYYSFTDSLTGTHNRHYLEKQLDSDIAHYLRNENLHSEAKNLWFLLVDVDHFKQINDEFGHPTGDEVLRQVAAVLRASVRDGDYLVRWGGEEFLIVLRPAESVTIEDICSRLKNKFERTQFIGLKGNTIKLTVSIGFCQYPLMTKLSTEFHWQKAIEIADSALYRSKRQGRNQWHGYRLKLEKIRHLTERQIGQMLEQRDAEILERISQ